MTRNKNLIEAKIRKNDEFYTLYSDIEKELKHYTKYFENKIVYCNCDSVQSNFWLYFKQNFADLKLKELIITGLKQGKDNCIYAVIYNGVSIKKQKIEGNGSFTDENCVNILQKADVVVTNPPFSKINDYIKLLIDNQKQFLIVGSKNWITYKAIFPLFMEHNLHLGYSNIKQFKQPDGSYKRFGNICWFTNLPVKQRSKQVQLQLFDASKYYIYDNYPAFEVGKLTDIFVDRCITIEISKWKLADWYRIYGNDVTIVQHKRKTVIIAVDNPIMGVPVTFMEQWHKKYSNFEVLGCSKFKGTYGSDYLGINHISQDWLNIYFKQGNHGHYSKFMRDPIYYDHKGEAKPTYIRIFIRRKKWKIII